MTLKHALSNGIPDPPQLTFPEAEAEFVHQAYANADVILEYGSGGSTMMAAEMPGKRVFSVESDRAWAENIRSCLRNSDKLHADVTILDIDVGPTKRWGKPVSDRRWRNYWRYPTQIYSEPTFQQPDLILVDGLFRSACVIAALAMMESRTRLLFDDFLDVRTNLKTIRPKHQELEEFIKPVSFVGRMAVFEVIPGQLDPASLIRALPLFFRYF